MILPIQLDLPFFSYGLFRPGQIGYGRLQPHVAAESEGVPCWLFRKGLMKPAGKMVISEPQIGRSGSRLEL